MNSRAVKKQVLDTIGSKKYKPDTPEGLAAALSLSAPEWPRFEELLRGMEREGLLLITKKGRIQSARASGVMTGTVRNITKTGGFASLADETGDVFIAKRNLAGAMPTDVVALKQVKKRGGLPEAAVVRILQQNFSEFTGTFSNIGGRGYVTADTAVRGRIPVAGNYRGVRDGDKVLARYEKGEAHIVSGFGPASSAASCCGAVLRRYHVRREFPAEVLENAAKEAALPETYEGRLDLRDKVIFTIDGATSKDLDDAISLEKTENGWLLGVHIADVSHFVREGSPLDEEALLRGTSIYYADTVIPMLPKELSNGICSLNPNEDRHAFSALMELDESGATVRSRFAKSVIRSRVKGVYEEINRLFDGSAGEELRGKYADVSPALTEMRTLAKTLTAHRRARGAVDIDSADCKITVGEDGIVDKVERREQGEAEIMIEEYMLTANEAVASYAVERSLPLVFRVHDAPEPKRLQELKSVLAAAGISTKGLDHDVRPQDISRLMETLGETGKAKVFQGLILRAMAKARYSPDCTGHFGLALERYCHFTSPIRRYPDLATHRILGDILSGTGTEEIVKHYRGFTEEASERSSLCEINAMQVERECEAIYKAEYMHKRLGESYEGFISSVRPFGFYVQLQNTVEGLCRLEDLDGGPYEYDERRLCVYNRVTKKSFTLGDSVSVRVTRADTATGQIDFELESPGR